MATANTEAIVKLCENFRIRPEVRDFIMREPSEGGLGLDSLDDIITMASDEKGIEDIVSRIEGIDDHTRQAARLKRAWKGIRDAEAEADRVRVSGETAADLDDILSKPELEQIRDAFWARHRLSFPPYVQPADAIVSRLHRELKKRLLTVRPLTWVKVLATQVVSETKRRKIGPNLFFEESDANEAVRQPQDVADYLRQLNILMIGYAFAGISRRTDAPAEEPFGADSILHVEVPYDVLMRYYWRAEERARQIHPANRLAWLRSRDEAERTKWVDMYRNSNETLGSVIANVFLQREASWDPPVESARNEPPTAEARQPADSQGRSFQPKTQDSHRNVEWGAATASGLKLCQDFQRNNCKGGKSCT